MNRHDLAVGLGLSGAVGAVFASAIALGMFSGGLSGFVEIAASFLFMVTLPAGAAAALCGRLAMSFGPETAFVVTGGAWTMLVFPYGTVIARGLRRLCWPHREPTT